MMLPQIVEPQFEQPKRKKRPKKWQPVKVTESLPTIVPKDTLVNNGTT